MLALAALAACDAPTTAAISDKQSDEHAQKVHNMVHEFGHTLGFRHGNYTQMGEMVGRR